MCLFSPCIAWCMHMCGRPAITVCSHLTPFYHSNHHGHYDKKLWEHILEWRPMCKINCISATFVPHKWGHYYIKYLRSNGNYLITWFFRVPCRYSVPTTMPMALLAVKATRGIAGWTIYQRGAQTKFAIVIIAAQSLTKGSRVGLLRAFG